MSDDGSPNDDRSRTDAVSPEKVERLASEWRESGRPFAEVTVVRREPPVSATVGDKALVTPDGELVGWVGGVSCAQSVVVREAMETLRTGNSTLVGLAPDPETISRPGLDAFPMTCHSGGVLELFVDPVMPTPQLVVVGDSPLARTLARLASELTYEVTVVADTEAAFRASDVINPDDDLVPKVRGADAVVVATMGSFDGSGIEASLRAGVPYVGLVASDRRAEDLFDRVADHLGVDADDVADAVSAPAGLDLNAETPEEIALSILAELVAIRRGATESASDTIDGLEIAAGTGDGEHVQPNEGQHDGDVHDHDHGASNESADDETAVDPVCGMDVDVSEGVVTVDHDGEAYHFCGQGCADAFADDPERFLTDGEARSR